MLRILRKLVSHLLWLCSGFLLGGVVLYLFIATRGADTSPWHEIRLEQEFSVAKADAVRDFQSYLELEDALFQELSDKIYQAPGGAGQQFNRFSSGSLSDPRVHGERWNRSFELPVKGPRGGVLMLHGMSDSPYSMKALAESLNRDGLWVIGLRLPGHGTAPSGLLEFRWEDMALAVRIAARHLSEKLGDKPLYLAGYSNGAALALDYALEAMEQHEYATPTGLILISPAIGLPTAAAFASTQARLAFVPGLKRLAWTTILPEFDPYKYTSFSVNAGEQAYRVTDSINRRIARLAKSPRLADFPPVIAFLSAVDATVSAQSVVDRLLQILDTDHNELVLFDVNRQAEALSLLVSDPASLSMALAANGALPFALTIVSNENQHVAELVERSKGPLSVDMRSRALGLAWPAGIFSLSHVALPFPPQDPVYGSENPQDPQRIYLGGISLQGERGVMVLPADWLLRLRHNPFFGYMEQRLLSWIAATAAPAGKQPNGD